jgi:hypothetical protein
LVARSCPPPRLVLPMFVAFTLDAASDGTAVLLRARARGRLCKSRQQAPESSPVILLIRPYGVLGAAWGARDWKRCILCSLLGTRPRRYAYRAKAEPDISDAAIRQVKFGPASVVSVGRNENMWEMHRGQVMCDPRA